MEPDDSTVICASVVWCEGVLITRWGTVNEGIEALFQRNHDSPKRVSSKVFSFPDILLGLSRLADAIWSSDTRSFFGPSCFSACIPAGTTKNIAEKIIRRTLMRILHFFII